MSKKRRGNSTKAAGGTSGYVSIINANQPKAYSIKRDALAGVLIVEAVNFDTTVFDTNDISTIRGASLSLLRIADAIADHLVEVARQHASQRTVHVLVKGASIVELAVVAPADEPAERLLASLAAAARAFLAEIIAFPVPKDYWTSNVDPSRFTFQVATASQNDLPPGLPNTSDTLSAMQALARSRLRVAQGQSRSFAMPVQQDLVKWSAFSDCGVHSGMSAVVEDGGDMVSAGVARRRAFGRSARAGMVLNALKAHPDGEVLALKITDEKWEFSRTLDMLLPGKGEQRANGIHSSVSGKIALIHIDGNGFAAKRAMIAEAGHLASFSSRLREIQAIVLTALIKAAMDEAADEIIRVETLLLGGDELVVAVPAWRAFDWLAIVQSALTGHQLDAGWVSGTATDQDRALTHATGMVFAQVKAPIRHLRHVVSALVDVAKDAPKGREGFPTAILVIEGFDLPYDGVKSVVRKLYGLGAETAIGPAFSFPGQAEAVASPVWLTQLKELRVLKALLPHRQAIRLVALTHSSDNEPLTDTLRWNAQVDEELNQVYGGQDVETIRKLIRSPLLGYSDKHPRMPLQHLIMLHNYLGGEAT